YLDTGDQDNDVEDQHPLPAESVAGLDMPVAETVYQHQSFRTEPSIKSDVGIELRGPLEVRGSVKSGGSIALLGDLIIRRKIDAYGAITVNGNVSTQGRIKAYGNIEVNGSLTASNGIKGFGKLRLVGSLQGTDLEIYGNLIVNGYLKCRRLLVYGSLTLIGAESSYTVEESEEIMGAKLRRDQEADWDW
ncbi:hypothetical protein GMORB2_2152, partial [Geosmithia morbida]